MKLGKHLLIAIVSSMVFYSCSSADESDFVEQGPEVVRFTSSVNGEVVYDNDFTRASGSTWASGDAIGVYMKKTGQDLSVPNIVNGANNIRYTTSGSVNFTVDNSAELVKFPEDGTKVDFIAYYPQDKALGSFIYKVNVSNQDKLEDIDLLYSNNNANVGKGNAVNLAFSHQLVKLELTVTPENLVESMAGLQATVIGMKTRADFDLSTGTLAVDNTSEAIFDAKVTVTGAKALIELIVLPQEATAGREIQIKAADNKIYKWKIPATKAFGKSTVYKYNVKLKTGNVIVVPNNGWFELPLIRGTQDNIKVMKKMLPDRPGIRNYTTYYDTNHKVAYWIAYPMHSYYRTPNTGRSGVWGYDGGVPHSEQHNSKAAYTSLESKIVYDRGHQVPSADRVYSKAGNQTTFVSTNTTPQNKDLNQGQWAALEDKIRKWMERCDTIYVVTGAMLFTEPGQAVRYSAKDASNEKITTPRYYFKALAQKRGDKYYTIGYRYENQFYDKKGDFQTSRLPLSELEKMTDFTFFPSLDDATKEKIDNSIWN